MERDDARVARLPEVACQATRSSGRCSLISALHSRPEIPRYLSYWGTLSTTMLFGRGPRDVNRDLTRGLRSCASDSGAAAGPQ